MPSHEECIRHYLVHISSEQLMNEYLVTGNQVGAYSSKERAEKKQSFSGK